MIVDADGAELVRTDIMETEGETQSVEFEATEGMAEYYCEVHPESMRGSIEVGDGGATGDAEQSTSTAISEGFSTGELTSENFAEPVNSSGSGAALFGLSEDGSELHYVLLVADMVDITQAHIHLGAADESGDVVAFLFGEEDDQGAFVGPLAQGVSGSGVLAEGTITGDDLVGPLEGESIDALAERLRAETAYVNVHTVENPAGEIRGQVAPAETVTVSLVERIETRLSQADGALESSRQTSLEIGDGADAQTPTGTETGTETPTGTEQQEQRGETEGAIHITYSGTVAPGNRVTITATHNGEPVSGANVFVRDGDGDRQLAGTTNSQGRLDVVVPSSGDKAGELRVKVRKGKLEGELEVEDDD